MIEKTKLLIRKLHLKKVVETFPDFLKDESASGKLILLATLLAIIAINSPLKLFCYNMNRIYKSEVI